MTRITSTILIMLLLFNASVTIMEGSGMSDDLGVDLAPGIGETLDSIVADLKGGFSPDAGPGETLFSLFAAGLGVVELVIKGTYAAPSMFLNLGFPAWFVGPVFIPCYVIGTLELVYVGTGRDMV